MNDRFDPLVPREPDPDRFQSPDAERLPDEVRIMRDHESLDRPLPPDPTDRRRERFYRAPIAWALAFAGIGGLILSILAGPTAIIYLAPLLAIFVFLPPLLTVYNVGFLLVNTGEGIRRRAAWKIECLTWGAGIPLTALYYWLFFMGGEYEGVIYADWWEQIYETQTHYPVLLETTPTLIVLGLVGIGGYLLLRLIPMEKQPPLVTVLAIGATYLGAAVSVFWIVQVINTPIAWPLMILPANAVLIYSRAVRLAVQDKWKLLKAAEAAGESGRLPRLSKLFLRAGLLPVWGLLLALPLLGVLVLILTLFGQQPDAFIRAWTDTADWTLSQKIPPPSVPMDTHYLCTVAAGGHGKVVKPLRTGKRHGHEVIVNRQLCVANAFEQLLEERTPRFHRFVRRNYDRYGLPIARLIRTKAAADVVYILMKPAEWIFLAVLYLFDRKPENRIAVQYPHKALPKER